jgi:hypothetical protein
MARTLPAAAHYSKNQHGKTECNPEDINWTFQYHMPEEFRP